MVFTTVTGDKQFPIIQDLPFFFPQHSTLQVELFCPKYTGGKEPYADKKTIIGFYEPLT